MDIIICLIYLNIYKRLIQIKEIFWRYRQKSNREFKIKVFLGDFLINKIILKWLIIALIF
jgi:hypothetical protein